MTRDRRAHGVYSRGGLHFIAEVVNADSRRRMPPSRQRLDDADLPPGQVVPVGRGLFIGTPTSIEVSDMVHSQRKGQIRTNFWRV